MYGYFAVMVSAAQTYQTLVWDHLFQTPCREEAFGEWTFRRGFKSSHRYTAERSSPHGQGSCVCVCVCVCVCLCVSWLPHLKLSKSCGAGEPKTLVCAELVASCHSNRGRACFAFSRYFSTLCMLLRYDNIAVRYITPAHGVYHSERHFMLYNHPIYISLCIKVLMHGVVKTALPYYLKMPAVSKHVQERSEGDLIVSQVVRGFTLKCQSFFFSCFLTNLISLHLMDCNHPPKHRRRPGISARPTLSSQLRKTLNVGM